MIRKATSSLAAHESHFLFIASKCECSCLQSEAGPLTSPFESVANARAVVAYAWTLTQLFPLDSLSPDYLWVFLWLESKLTSSKCLHCSLVFDDLIKPGLREGEQVSPSLAEGNISTLNARSFPSTRETARFF